MNRFRSPALLLVVSKDPRSGEAASRSLRSGSRQLPAWCRGTGRSGTALLSSRRLDLLPRYAGDAPTQDVAS